MGEAQVDGDAPLLLLGQPVGVGAREGLDEGRLADTRGAQESHRPAPLEPGVEGLEASEAVRRVHQRHVEGGVAVLGADLQGPRGLRTFVARRWVVEIAYDEDGVGGRRGVRTTVNIIIEARPYRAGA